MTCPYLLYLHRAIALKAIFSIVFGPIPLILVNSFKDLNFCFTRILIISLASTLVMPGSEHNSVIVAVFIFIFSF